MQLCPRAPITKLAVLYWMMRPESDLEQKHLPRFIYMVKS